MAMVIRRLMLDRDDIRDEDHPYEFYDNEQYEIQDLNHISQNLVLMELFERMEDRDLLWVFHDEYYDFRRECFTLEFRENINIHIDTPDNFGIIDVTEMYGEKYGEMYGEMHNKAGCRFGIRPGMDYRERKEYYDTFLDRLEQRIDKLQKTY